MAYVKQNFKSGDTLYASQLNAMDNELKAVSDAVAELAYKQIVIPAFSASPSTAELGSTVSSVVLSWTINKVPTSLKIDGVTVASASASGTVTKNGSYTAAQNWLLTATDERGMTATKTAALQFLNRIYYGAAPAPGEIDSAFLLALANTPLAESRARTFTVTAGNGEYIWYAIPARKGNCSFEVGGFAGGFALVSTFDHMNASGYTESYAVYRSDNSGLGATMVEVS